MTDEHTGGGDLTRSLELLWNPGAVPSRGPKRNLTLARVVEAAIALADREGLSALSMRNVASELGVGTMSLYRYVPGKGELIDLMVDHVNGPAEATAFEGLGWREAMERIAEDSWTLYTTSSWLIQINQSRPILGPRSMAGVETALTPLRGLGLTSQEKMSLLVALDNFVLGSARSHILERQAAQESGVSDEDFWAAQEPFLERAIESGNYPNLASVDEDAFSATGLQVMRFGLRALLDGFQALVDARDGRLPEDGSSAIPPDDQKPPVRGAVRPSPPVDDEASPPPPGR
ncbi:TetR/AcrR family transcriptional regulator [Streptomyces sp. AJS327]|uniref:TetR/AcrR family transcriptional regulator n=1 Tax=Streptomyces sp. AJS327 TaxID=2545265 RepID=UPI0015DDBC82|nr:TetR/AcrR family transcriptional regulator [Streptomyces sp. AJS327]MBA0053227.1 TetR/AcrR family transcriptional regulator [Streptomyces sp. AJS327]